LNPVQGSELFHGLISRLSDVFPQNSTDFLFFLIILLFY